MDLPIICWVCTLTSNFSKEDLVACIKAVKEQWPQNPFAQSLPSNASPDVSKSDLVQIIELLLPVLMMRQQRVPRTKWRSYQAERGAKWIERDPAGMHPSKHLSSMMGYSTVGLDNAVVMTATQGKRNQVLHIGLHARSLFVNMPVREYAATLAHKLTPSEIKMLTELPDEQLLNRLTIIICIKEALVDAWGRIQRGFDQSRIETNIPAGTIRIDTEPLLGWEFRLFKFANEWVTSDRMMHKSIYQVCVALYRHNNVSKYNFVENPKDIEKMIQYFPMENLMRVIPKLMQDDGGETLTQH